MIALQLKPPPQSGTTRVIALLLTGLLLAPICPGQMPAQELQPTQKLQEELVPGFQRDKERFTLNLKEAKLREVLLLLTKDTGYSLIVDPAVDGTIAALDLKDVTFKEALDAILPGMGLEYQISDNLLKVTRPGMQTRIFYLNYIAADRNGKREMRMSSRSTTGGSNTGGSGSGQSSTDSTSGQSSGGGQGGSESENDSTITTYNSSAVWQDLRLGLEAILFAGGPSNTGGNAPAEEKGPAGYAVRDSIGRILLLNPQAGMIMVHAGTSDIEEAGRYIEAVEGSIQRQVLIEAKVVEVSLSKDNTLGVDWSAVLSTAGGIAGTLSSANGITSPAFTLNSGPRLSDALNSDYGAFQIGISNGRVGAMLDALGHQGKLHVISTPRISTLNNQKAVIRVVREEVFFTLNSTTSQSTGASVTTQNVTTQVVPIGIVMDIIPQIGSDGGITLSVNPSISELVEIKQFQSPDQQSLATQPVIDRRDLDTVAKVKSGQTMLIAGILKETKASEMRGVPGLMHLPFFGSAFRRTEDNNQRTELVIFITPTILTGKRIEDLTQQEQERLSELRKDFEVLGSKKGKTNTKN